MFSSPTVDAVIFCLILMLWIGVAWGFTKSYGSPSLGLLPARIAIYVYHPLFTLILFARAASPATKGPILLSIAALFISIGLIICSFASLYRVYGVSASQNDSPRTSFRDCVYFSIVTWSTVGYGDFVPSSPRSRCIAAYQVLTGYVTMGALVAALAAMIRLA